MESWGFTPTPKDPIVNVKGSWDGDDFAAGGIRVHDLVGIGSGKMLSTLVKVIDVKCQHEIGARPPPTRFLSPKYHSPTQP